MNKKILSFFICLFFISCTEKKEKETINNTVKVFSVETYKGKDDNSYPILLSPYRETTLSFRVGGPINEFNVQEGQYFNKGEVIAEIDNRDYLINKKRSEALLNQTESEYIRIKNLYEKGNISGSTYEKAKADFEKAKADAESAINALNDTRLVAPFDGYVQQVHIERYQDVKPTAPVVTFIDLSRVKAEAFVPEEIAVNWNKGNNTSCLVRLNAMKDKNIEADEVFLTQTATANNISYQLTAIIKNNDKHLMGGMAGEMTIVLPTDSTTYEKYLIPQSLICHNEQIGDYVWRVSSSNRVSKTPVTLGRLRSGAQVEVLKGLNTGDCLAATRLSFLSEGMEIVKSKDE